MSILRQTDSRPFSDLPEVWHDVGRRQLRFESCPFVLANRQRCLYHAVTGSESSYADDSVREGMRNSHSQFSRKTSASSGHDNSPSSERGLFFWLGVVALVTLIAGMWGLVALIATLIPVNLLYFGSLLFWHRSPGCLADHYGLIRTFITIALYLFAGLMLVSFVNYLHLLIVVPLFPGLLGLEPATM